MDATMTLSARRTDNTTITSILHPNNAIALFWRNPDATVPPHNHREFYPQWNWFLGAIPGLKLVKSGTLYPGMTRLLHALERGLDQPEKVTHQGTWFWKCSCPAKIFVPSQYLYKPCKAYVYCWENKYMPRLKNHLPSWAHESHDPIFLHLI